MIERDFPSTLGKTIRKFIVFPLQHRLIRHIFATEKTSNNPQNNLDYETYIISNRSGNRDDNIRKRPETYQHSSRSQLHHRQDDGGIGIEQVSPQQHPEHQPVISQRHQQLSRHRRLWMAIPQQAAKTHSLAQSMETFLRIVLLLPSDKLVRQRICSQHLREISETLLSLQAPPVLRRQTPQTLQEV